MSNFRELTDDFFASPQIEAADVSDAKQIGITLIVNNRPDGEEPTAPQGDEIASAAEAAGIDYLAIPVGHSGFSLPQVEAMADALKANSGKVLGYCRSGTRSTLLWAMARAKMGDAPDEIAAAAERGGYSTSPVQPTIDMLAREAQQGQ